MKKKWRGKTCQSHSIHYGEITLLTVRIYPKGFKILFSWLSRSLFPARESLEHCPGWGFPFQKRVSNCPRMLVGITDPATRPSVSWRETSEWRGWFRLCSIQFLSCTATGTACVLWQPVIEVLVSNELLAENEL